MNALVRLGGPMVTLVRATRAVARRGVSAKAVLELTYEAGNRSIWLVLSGLTFFGVVMVTIAHAQASKLIGNLTVLGPPYFELLVRSMGPLISAVLAAVRIAARDSAELASMSVNEQVEALEMCAGDPLVDLVAPRTIAGLIAIPCLGVVGTGAAAIAAALTASWAFGVDGAAFLDPRFITHGDLWAAGATLVLCGLFVPLAACWRGLAASGGSMAVGDATTEGVVTASVGCLVIDLIVGLVLRAVGL